MIHRVDSGSEHWGRSAFVISIVGKVGHLADSGQLETVEKAITTVQTYDAQHPTRAIIARHRFWTLADATRESRK